MAEIVWIPGQPQRTNTGYREVCDWCELEHVGGRVPEDQQVGHGKLCRECFRRTLDIAEAGTAEHRGRQWMRALFGKAS